jgi:hypothetical protein
MKKFKHYLTLLVFLLIATRSFSQDNTFLDTLPTTKEEFIKSEPAVINTIDWLENTPLGQEPERRKLFYATFLAWLTNSPTVTIDLNAKVTPFLKKNPDLLFAFMGGWTKYTLQNAYSKDATKCNLAGIRSAIKQYQMGNGIKKDKEMEKLIDMDGKSELEPWLSTQLGQK